MSVSRFTRKIREAVRHKNSEHASLALKHLFKSIDTSQSARILDLGGACASNIKFYSAISKKFHFEDLSAAIAAQAQNKNGKAEQVPSVLEEALTLRKNQVFDLIFCWDIVNYLNPTEISRLGEIISAHAHAETKIFLLLPVGREIARAPIRFKLIQHDRLDYEEGDGARTNSPRYNKTDLKKYWPKFKRSKSFLLKNGFEEHIFGMLDGDSKP